MHSMQPGRALTERISYLVLISTGTGGAGTPALPCCVD